MQNKNYFRVLTIAGSDSGGGAGIQADIKTVSALGCYAASAITAVTVQNTVGVSAVHPVPEDIVEGQIRAVLDDIGADAVKIGMLQSSGIVSRIAKVLKDYGMKNIVLDPVMVSTSGHRLIEESAIGTLKEELIPMARVITPNIPEAEILLGDRILPDQASLPYKAKMRMFSHQCHSMTNHHFEPTPQLFLQPRQFLDARHNSTQHKEQVRHFALFYFQYWPFWQ